mmetsp:Transcript_17038/g.30771  ORF Transcript_17038/g.30771 Transcript_17038/m.30771 type:complete len:158 (-) Transcript_17038:41-514(-)
MARKSVALVAWLAFALFSPSAGTRPAEPDKVEVHAVKHTGPHESAAQEAMEQSEGGEVEAEDPEHDESDEVALMEVDGSGDLTDQSCCCFFREDGKYHVDPLHLYAHNCVKRGCSQVRRTKGHNRPCFRTKESPYDIFCKIASASTCAALNTASTDE